MVCPSGMHLPQLPSCPHLPPVAEPLKASAMKACGTGRGREFYLQALRCAHSLWLQGLPAQSLLLLNRALGADHRVDPDMCREWPLPYRAVAWVLQNRREDHFIGNPRRHYQHLATRMVEPRKEERTWRAWACWLLARRILPDFPADEKQIAEEGVREPTREEIHRQLALCGMPGEAPLWEEVLEGL